MSRRQHEWTDSFVETVATVATSLSPIDLSAVSTLALEQARHAVCITDARIDSPGPVIEFVNQAYLDIFAADEADVVGVSPRHGQGPLTDRSVLDRLRAHLVAGASIQAQAINYRADRSTFRLRWSIDAIRRAGRVEKFFAVLHDVTIDDRMRRRLSALDALVHAGPAITSTAGADDRAALVASAVRDAVEPMVAEIGGVRVTIGGSTLEVAAPAHVDGVALTASRFSIGDVGEVALDVHPDANELLDVAGVEEIVRHGHWLATLTASH